MSRCRSSLWLLCLCSSWGALAAVEIDGALKAWHRITLSWQGPERSEQPATFLDHRLDVVFTGPSGQRYTVPGHFAADGRAAHSQASSGAVWRCHFAADEAGTWNWQVRFRTGTDVAVASDPDAGSPSAFDGDRGSVVIGPTDKTGQDFRGKGRLVVAEGGARYPHFLGTGGFFLKGAEDDPEALFGYSGFDNTPNASVGDLAAHVADWQSGDPTWAGGRGKGLIGALNYLASQDVNGIYFLTMNIGGDGKDTWPYASTSIDRNGSSANDNLTFDCSKLDQWEIAMSHAQQLGILLHLVLNEAERANKEELDNAQLGRERKLYYRELISRFGHHNALQWNVSEEYDLGLDLGVARVREFGRFIRDTDPYGHPLAVHNTGTIDAGHEYQQFFAADPANPFTTTSVQDRGPDQSSRSGKLVTETLAIARAWGLASGNRPMPLNIDEQDDLTDSLDWDISGSTVSMPEQRRELIWPLYLSGGAGVEMYKAWDGDKDFRDFEPLFRWMAIARHFVEDHLPYWEMQDADGLLSGETVYDQAQGEVFAKPGHVYAIYFPRATETGSLQLPAGGYTLRWFDPRDGGFVGPPITLGGGVVSLPPVPSDPSLDWVALIAAGAADNRDPILESGPQASSDPVIGTSIGVQVTASDPDGDTLTYAWSANGPAAVGFAPAGGSGAATTTATFQKAGAYTISVIIGDGRGGSISGQVAVTVAQTPGELRLE